MHKWIKVFLAFALIVTQLFSSHIFSVTMAAAAGEDEVVDLIEHNKTFSPLFSGGDDFMQENPDRGYRSEYTLYPDMHDLRAQNPDITAAQYINQKFSIYIKTENGRAATKLIYTYIDLHDYRETGLDQDFFSMLQLFFDECRGRKIKSLLSFYYCNDRKPDYCTCATQAQILRDIADLRQIVADNKDVIHTIKGGFIAYVGEWVPEYQDADKPVDYPTVIKAIVDNFCIPNDLYFQIRLPRYKNMLSAQDLETYGKWIGFTNDGMYGEQTLEGFHSGEFQIGNGNGMWEQVTAEGYRTPQDGEMFYNSTLLYYNMCPTGKNVVLETAHHRHVSMSLWHGYYDTGFPPKDTAVMKSWFREYITPAWCEQNNVVYDPQWFTDEQGNSVQRNAFEFLRDHLGYRLSLQQMHFSADNATGSAAEVSLTLKNYGMAVAFNLESGFAILNENGDAVSQVRAGEPREWYSHLPDTASTAALTHTVNGTLTLPDAVGTYRLAFYLRNSLNEFVRFANDAETVGGYVILDTFTVSNQYTQIAVPDYVGEVTVGSPFPAGTVYPATISAMAVAEPFPLTGQPMIQCGRTFTVNTVPIEVKANDGVLVYIQVPDDGVTYYPMPYISKDGNASYVRSGGTWYCRDLRDSEWHVNTVENYGIPLPSGFAGYLYIPLATMTVNPWIDGDLFSGVKFWLYQGENGATACVDKPHLISAPMIVRGDTLTGGLLTAKAVINGHCVTLYADVNG